VWAPISAEVDAFIRPAEGKCATSAELFAFRCPHRPTQDPVLVEYQCFGTDSMLACSHVHGDLTIRGQGEWADVRQERW